MARGTASDLEDADRLAVAHKASLLDEKLETSRTEPHSLVTAHGDIRIGQPA